MCSILHNGEVLYIFLFFAGDGEDALPIKCLQDHNIRSYPHQSVMGYLPESNFALCNCVTDPHGPFRPVNIEDMKF